MALAEEESDCEMYCIQPITIQVPIKGFKAFQDLEVPCGKCIGCRIAKRKEWSLRMLHELTYHPQSSFITLTYDDYHLPSDNSLKKRHLQLFIKRLRKNLGERRIKYFACGEYGGQTMRPHYHAILFGSGLTREDKNRVIDCWPLCDWTKPSIRKNSFGIAEPDSIRYVAQYIDKKFTGDMAEEIYVNQGIEPVFRLLSQGIGLQYALDNKSQIEELSYITLKGVKHSVPRYYIKKLDLDVEKLREQALVNDCEKNEHYSGVNISTDNALRSLNPELIHSIYDGDMRSRKQKKRNLEAKVMLKQSKL